MALRPVPMPITIIDLFLLLSSAFFFLFPPVDIESAFFYLFDRLPLGAFFCSAHRDIRGARCFPSLLIIVASFLGLSYFEPLASPFLWTSARTQNSPSLRTFFSLLLDPH